MTGAGQEGKQLWVAGLYGLQAEQVPGRHETERTIASLGYNRKGLWQAPETCLIDTLGEEEGVENLVMFNRHLETQNWNHSRETVFCGLQKQ